MMPGSRVDRHLQQAERWWKWQLLLRRLALLGFVLVGLTLVVGIAMRWGLFQHRAVPASLLLLIGVGGLLVAVVLLMMTFDRQASSRFLASAVERTHPSLLDRLNTLIYLRYRNDRLANSVRPEIEQQALQVLGHEPQTCPFSWGPTVMRLLTLAALLLGVVAFYAYLNPWRNVRTDEVATAASAAHESLEIPPPPADEEPAANDREDWTEIRISRPGHDLQVTRHEVLPLVIEAASTRRLEQLRWLTGVNALPQQEHLLPRPADPRYFVHESEIVLEDFALETWDVLAYFAQATTEDDRQHDSPLYFVHLVPDRQQLQQLPGGEQGEAYRTLQELTGLIQRQQEVLRQTWQARRQPSDTQDGGERASRLEALAREESQLRDEIDHLTAALHARLDEAPLQDLEQSLQQAQNDLQATRQQLQQRAATEAIPPASQTLSNLVMSRKQFQQLVQDHPSAFEPKEQRLADERPPRDGSTDVAAAPAQDANTLPSAREFVQQALLKQRDIERAAGSRSNRPQLAQRQLDLQQSLKEFVEQNPQAFERTRGECQQAQAAMRQAAQSLQAGASQARQHAQQAAESLQQLDSALERQQQRTALVDAHRLQQELEQQVEQLQQMEQRPPASPSSTCKSAGGRAKSAADEAQRLAQRPGTSEGLSSQLQQALGEGQQQQIDEAADRLAGVRQADEVPPAAQGLRKPLQQLAERLRQALQGQHGGQPLPALLPKGQQAVDQGLRQLESLARRQSGNRPLSNGAKLALTQEALSNLNEGIADMYGHNERTEAVMQRLRRDLDPSVARVDLQTLRDLTRQIQLIRRERAVTVERRDDPAEMTGLDPTRLPPEYRESIRKYFEQLSRQP